MSDILSNPREKMIIVYFIAVRAQRSKIFELKAAKSMIREKKGALYLYIETPFFRKAGLNSCLAAFDVLLLAGCDVLCGWFHYGISLLFFFTGLSLLGLLCSLDACYVSFAI